MTAEIATLPKRRHQNGSNSVANEATHKICPSDTKDRALYFRKAPGATVAAIRRPQRPKRDPLQHLFQKATLMISRFIATLAWVFLLWFATPLPLLAQPGAESIRLTHVHGLFFSADGAQLKIPGHRGIATFERGQWTRVPVDGSDFAGFAAARDVWFASGHPGLASDATEVLGLGRSTDGGKTWQTLGFAGDSDFHHLAAGYRSAALYLFNTSANAVMPQPGIYRSRDQGAQWRRVTTTGLSGEITRLAVHPDDPSMVVIGTSAGLYLSRDGVETFSQLQAGKRIFAVALEPTGHAIWYGTYSKRAKLVVRSLMSSAVEREVPLPVMHGDAVAFIAFNPVVNDEVAIATTRRNVFISRNKGKDWIQIVHEGDTSV
jgi:photosystem II stability/assembly factor-like uncharacterized protein